MPLPGSVRYRLLNPSESQRFLYEDNLSLYRIICPSCGIYEPKSYLGDPTKVLSLTLIYFMSLQQAGRLSGLNVIFVRLLGPGPTLPGLTLTLAMQDWPLLYCILVYLYPVSLHPY